MSVVCNLCLSTGLEETSNTSITEHIGRRALQVPGNGFQGDGDGCEQSKVLQDYLTKWPEVFAVPDRTASTVAKCL